MDKLNGIPCDKKWETRVTEKINEIVEWVNAYMKKKKKEKKS